MDIKARRKVIDDLISRLKSDLDSVIPNIPEHWERKELEWLLVRMAERLTSVRSDLGLRRRSFKHSMLSKHL